MGIATTIRRFLDTHGVPYDIVPHPYTNTSYGSAKAAHVSPDRVAKGVLLKKDDDYLLAVVPASRKLDLSWLIIEVEHDLELAGEDELAEIFFDCAYGAVPAVGPAYGLDTLVENCLRAQPELYFEAGDHEELVHIKELDYETLLGNVRYLSFTHFPDAAEARVRPVFD
ncbi:MAG: YbaK/EbsC family protein [Gammaproteobacteria bacterium]|nr:YbaK/EbsC family protein [Gammaproteobacteria bacterium]